MKLGYLKPSRFKILISSGLTALWYALILVQSKRMKYDCFCFDVPVIECPDYKYFLLIKTQCFCDCVPFIAVLKQYLLFIIIPFVLVYLVLSLYSVIKKK